MSDKMKITDETLAKFDALENVKSARQPLVQDEDLSVDTAGLLAVHTPLKESAIQLEAAIGPAKASSTMARRARQTPALIQRARHWTRDPAKLWIVGLTCVIAAGLLTFIVLMLTNSI